MPSVRYYNQTAPFWDFVAGLEEQGAQHPFFAGPRQQGETSESETEQPTAWGWGGFPFGPMAHRGRHGPHGHHEGGPGRHHRRGPPGPPAPEDDQEMPPPPPAEGSAEAGPSEHRGPPPPPSSGPGPHRHNGGPRHPGPHGFGPFGRRGGWGGRGRGCGRRGMGGPFGGLAEMFQSQLFGEQDAENNNKSEDFTPDVDVFDTTEAFVIHVSLAGAKKEDVGVNWDAEKSELNIAGVVYRPGDEEFLKTLAMDERKIGAFERKIRLGSRANPAQVDIDGISARLEDGVLRIEVPKMDSGFVEVKKVDIE